MRLKSLLAIAGVIGSSLFLVAAAPSAQAAVGTLYGATGGAGDCAGLPSSLYTVDPTTGAATVVAPITVNGNQQFHVVGIAVNPVNGQLYGVRNGQDSNCDDFYEATLLAIDSATGAATIVGSAGSVAGRYPDIGFAADGTLYGWNEDTDSMWEIDTATGTSTEVSDWVNTARTGLDVDPAGRVWMKSGNELHRVNPATGEVAFMRQLSTDPQNLLTFASDGTAFTGTRSNTGSTIQKFDPFTGTVTTVGSNSVKLTGLAFHAASTTPTEADLSVTKTVDDASPLQNTNVTFTVTVANAGPDEATVVVKDLLPSGLSFVSATPSAGSYVSSTGLWSVGSLASGADETLGITATVTASNAVVNEAQVWRSDAVDPDSFDGGGSSSEDDYDSVSVDPYSPGIDGAVELVRARGGKPSSTRAGFRVVVTNDGIYDLAVSTSQVTVTVNDQDVTSCRSVSRTLRPGRHMTIPCEANIAALGVGSGATLTYEATLDVPLDEDQANDVDSQVVTTT